MQAFYLVLGGLVTYRLSLLISKEDGPAYLFRKLRKQAPSASLREGLSCEWCMSIWAGALVAAYYWWISIIPGREWPLYWLAMSAIGIICNQQWTRGSAVPANASLTQRSPAEPSIAGAEQQEKAEPDRT